MVNDVPGLDRSFAAWRIRCAGRSPARRNPSEGAEHTAGGEYIEVRRPDRLIYTWAWEPEAGAPAPDAPSRVTVDFVADGDGTRVELTHRGLASDASRAPHEHGWNACFDNLAQRVFA